MDELASTLEFDRTATLHHTRTHAIRAVMTKDTASEPDCLSVPLHYALAHHFLEGAERAARQRDHDTLTWYRTRIIAPPQHWITPTPFGPTIIQSPDPHRLLRSPIADAPYHLLGPEDDGTSGRAVELGVSALDLADMFGFGHLLAQNAPIICLLIERDLTSPLNSWTITRLPGTVFLDHVGDPTILARDLIHEAGHNWLNDALNATSTVIDDEHTYHSPWKNTPRPTFGYLHSCWAFPLTMIFVARAVDTAAPAIRTVLTAYLNQHRDKLAATAKEFHDASSAVSDPDLRERLRTIHSMARKM